jgi:hypothetical protein
MVFIARAKMLMVKKKGSVDDPQKAFATEEIR